MHYLLSVNRKLKNEDKLFKINESYFGKYFEDINDQLNLGKAGAYNRFVSHMLRRFQYYIA